MKHIVIFLFLFCIREVFHAKSVNTTTTKTNVSGSGRNASTSTSSSSLSKIVRFRIGSMESAQQLCRCVTYYQCDSKDVVDVTSSSFLNESDISCALEGEVCCKNIVDLGGPIDYTAILPLPPVTSLITDTTVNPQTVTSDLQCTCVPTNLCNIGDPEKEISGADKIDIRFTNCTNQEICCFPSELILTPPPVTVVAQPDIDVPVSVAPRLPTICGVRNFYKDTVDTRIISPPGVSDTVFGEFPWMAVLLRTDIDEQGNRHENTFLCGASLISPSFIMTAAHCVNNIDKSLIKVRVGEYDTHLGAKREPLPHQDSTVSTIIAHPNFNARTLFNDIAILTVENKFNLTPNVNPICLPANDTFYNPRRCIATGWGKNSFEEGGRFQTTLKKVELGLIPNDECQQRLKQTPRLGKYFVLDPSFVCAGGEQGADTCKGDGGGPLVCEMVNYPNRYVQVGIVAWGIGCGDTLPAVYASIEANLKWVNDLINDLTFGGVFRRKMN